MESEGFKNLAWFGEGGADRGRDITCDFFEKIGTKEVLRKRIVQCKRYRNSVPRRVVHDELAKATQFEVDYFILATSSTLSANTKDWLSTQKRFGFETVLWEGTDLEMLLSKHQQIRWEFLRVSASANFLFDYIATQHRVLTTIGDWPIEATAQSYINLSWKLAQISDQILSTGHLLLAMIDTEGSVLHRYLSGGQIDCKRIRTEYASFVEGQKNRIEARSFITVDYISVIENAHHAMIQTGIGEITDLVICWLIILQDSLSLRKLFEMSTCDTVDTFKEFLRMLEPMNVLKRATLRQEEHQHHGYQKTLMRSRVEPEITQDFSEPDLLAVLSLSIRIEKILKTKEINTVNELCSMRIVNLSDELQDLLKTMRLDRVLDVEGDTLVDQELKNLHES